MSQSQSLNFVYTFSNEPSNYLFESLSSVKKMLKLGLFMEQTTFNERTPAIWFVTHHTSHI